MTGVPAALALELNCRYLSPLLDIVEEKQQLAELRRFLLPWHVEISELRNQSNWVSLRFCEGLVDWLGSLMGADELANRVARAVYSPRALGFMYPILRAIGSPRVGYGRLAQVVGMLNKVSVVTVAKIRRGFAEIEYRPATPELVEHSPLICHLRKAQIVAGPTLWSLPPARIDELGCQARGADSCRYRVRWVDRAPWRGTLLGLIVGTVAALALPHHTWTGISSVLLGLALGRIWDLRTHTRELQAFVEEHTEGLRDALNAAEQRFVELQKAKTEVDAKVEERTAQLKIATEQRVHTEKLAVLGTLAAGLAHEVRNPANAIVTGLRPLRRYLEKLGADPDYVEVVDIAVEAGEQISHLVGDLLDIGRTDRGLEPWDPHQGIEAAIRLLSHRAQGLTFLREFEFDGQIIGRPPALNQIFLNLIDNAVRAAGQGGRVRLRTRAQPGGAQAGDTGGASHGQTDGIEITVADSGPGVSVEDAQRIFDPFFTTRTVGEGTGLGLHFSRQVAYDHSGTLDLVSASGWGACFRLWLPTKPGGPT